MVRKLIKWAAMMLGGLLGLVALTAGVLYGVGNARLTKHYTIQPEAVVIPSDTASIQQGQQWANFLCAHCHGTDLSGTVILNDAIVGYLPAPNLTPGKGSITKGFTDADWVRVLRHGVTPEGRPVIAMPSQNYYHLNEQDLGQLLAYLKQLPPVDHELGATAMSFTGKVLLAAGLFGDSVLPAEVIAHRGPRPLVQPVGVTVEYGDYLVRLGGCRDCHGQDFSGGKSPEPGAPPAPNLTPGGIGAALSAPTFILLVRTMESKNMPWSELKPLRDPELEAIYLFLHALPAK